MPDINTIKRVDSFHYTVSLLNNSDMKIIIRILFLHMYQKIMFLI